MCEEVKNYLESLIENVNVAPGFRWHAKQLLAGNDPSGGVVSKELQIEALIKLA